jgi:hypothetical protein
LIITISPATQKVLPWPGGTGVTRCLFASMVAFLALDNPQLAAYM